MNLAKLSKEEREAIELDKKLWLKCHSMMNTKTRSQIVAWLNSLPEVVKEEARRRLNLIRERKRKL